MGTVGRQPLVFEVAGAVAARNRLHRGRPQVIDRRAVQDWRSLRANVASAPRRPTEWPPYPRDRAAGETSASFQWARICARFARASGRWLEEQSEQQDAC